GGLGAGSMGQRGGRRPDRPGPGAGAGAGLGKGPSVGGGPSKADLGNFLDISGPKGAPGAGPDLGSGPSAVGDFFKQSPAASAPGLGAPGLGKGVAKGPTPGVKAGQ